MLDASEQARFADVYMAAVKAKGVEVIALADHNTHDWIDVMCAAGARNGIVVFPGCEVTTGSGSDGIHLIVIGDRSKTGRDFDHLLAGVIGFGEGHPRFHDEAGKRVPGSSGKMLTQILDDLPDEYLVVAPHALTDNGIASAHTAKGDIRWKALHHERLNALDPGDCSASDSKAFNTKFRQRELDHLPCLKEMAFVATSDAYRLEDIGCRFSWLRMGEPTLEAMRQAFLDHEARIICDWDARLAAYPNGDPNEVRHAWISSVTLGGSLGNSRSPLSIPLHPGLNAIIGGRGSGKSTVVAAIRQIYAGTSTLPEKVRDEAESFATTVFSAARLSADHLLANSRERQTAAWDASTGSVTAYDTGGLATTFKVRVVNQKELFERVARNKDDAFAASRSFLAFLDEGLGFARVPTPAADSWWRNFDGACADWSAAMRSYQLLVADLGQLPAVQARCGELEAQLLAFDSPEAVARRTAIRARFQEREASNDRIAAFEGWLDSFPVGSQVPLPVQLDDLQRRDDDDAGGFERTFGAIEQGYRYRLHQLREEARRAVADFRGAREGSAWWASVAAAELDADAYAAELAAKGIDPRAYGELQQQLRAQATLLKQLALKATERDAARGGVDAAWGRVEHLLLERLQAREQLLAEVGARSGTLRFSVIARRDVVAWVSTVRELLNLRSDAFLEDVPALATWLWECDGGQAADRWRHWRDALASGDFGPFTASAKPRQPWLKKLVALDPSQRMRLAVEVAPDVVIMKFLRDGGLATQEEDWQAITEGSPGQRTAAMLGFVLHHGVEPLVLDQPEDDLDTEWISNLVVKELRASRWKRQIIVVTHNANIPVNGDADQVIVLENQDQELRVRVSTNEAGVEVCHCGPIELSEVRADIQNIMEGGINAFIRREKKYNNEMRIRKNHGSSVKA